MKTDRNAEADVAPPVQQAVGRPAPEPETLAGLIARMEREAFERWATGEGLDLNRHRHSYLSTSTAWAWDAWRGRGAMRVPCRGVTRDGCNYLAPCGSICNKCGHEH